jgi:hypothetical protein
MIEIYWQPQSDRKDCGHSSGFYSMNLRVLSHLIGPLSRLDQGRFISQFIGTPLTR